MTAKIDNRKDVLLLLLALPGHRGQANEPVNGRTRLMKLLFLAQRQLDVQKKLGLPQYYSFEAYHYGPFSKDVFDDVDFLKNVGLIQSTTIGPAARPEEVEEAKLFTDANASEEEESTAFFEERFELTEKGKRFASEKLLPDLPHDMRDRLSRLKADAGRMDLTTLLRWVYTAYPEEASKSRLPQLAG